MHNVRQNCQAYCLLCVVCSVIGGVDNLTMCDKSNGLKFMVGLCFGTAEHACHLSGRNSKIPEGL